MQKQINTILDESGLREVSFLCCDQAHIVLFAEFVKNCLVGHKKCSRKNFQ